MSSDSLRNSQLKGYLRENYVKPDMSANLWKVARACLDNTKTSFYALRFSDDLSMRQFMMAVLLSSGRQFNWHEVKSYQLVQGSLDGSRLLTEYEDFDLVFVVHSSGTMRNSIMGQSINQLSVLRSPKKTFFFDRGGYSLQDLVSPIVLVSQLMSTVSKVLSKGDDL